MEEIKYFLEYLVFVTSGYNFFTGKYEDKNTQGTCITFNDKNELIVALVKSDEDGVSEAINQMTIENAYEKYKNWKGQV